MARRLLPPELDLNRKRGFSLPLAAWFRAGWSAFCADTLMRYDKQIPTHRMIGKLLAGQLHGFSNTSCLFALLLFELLRQQ